MFNVIYFDDEITDTKAPKKLTSGNFRTLRNGYSMYQYKNYVSEFTEELPNLANGQKMFLSSSLTKFTGDLSSLTDGTSMFAWCSSFESFEGNLRNMLTADYMFDSCKKLKSFTNNYGGPPNLSSLTKAWGMFRYCEKLESFTSDLSSLVNGSHMFTNCTNLATFSSDLSSLTEGSSMFMNCKFNIFSSNLSSLTRGNSMFRHCENLTTFSDDLSSLEDGTYMFQGCAKLHTFSSDLSSLVNGEYMFYDCENLTTFSNDLSSLMNGYYMFRGCNNLTTFASDLSSLVNGYYMFYQTKLTPQSVMYILESIKDLAAEKLLYTSGTVPYVTITNSKYSAPQGFMSDGRYAYTYNTITTAISNVGKLIIGINVTNDANTITDQLQAFAEGAYYDSWADLKKAFVNKGWTVTWQFGGTTTSIPYDLRGDRTIPCPVYTQLIEILPQEGEDELTDEQKEMAEYCSDDGTRYYNIYWGHEVTHPEEYQQFDSLEDAAIAYGIIRKEFFEIGNQPTLF